MFMMMQLLWHGKLFMNVWSLQVAAIAYIFLRILYIAISLSLFVVVLNSFTHCWLVAKHLFLRLSQRQGLLHGLKAAKILVLRRSSKETVKFKQKKNPLVFFSTPKLIKMSSHGASKVVQDKGRIIQNQFWMKASSRHADKEFPHV